MQNSGQTEQRWISREADPTAVAALARELGVGCLLARVLVGRGFDDAASARAFLDSSIDTEPFDAAGVFGLAAVADALSQAIDRHASILVFGDFDVDGLSATALLTIALQGLGANVRPMVPSRLEEGYGLTEQVIPRILADQPDVLVTVDCGISADHEARLLMEKGIEVLVTDHHEPGDQVPTGALVADPKLGPDGFGYDLAGAGVALALVKLLGERHGRHGLWRGLTDLACLGTVADMVPLTGFNRALVRDGLSRLNHSPRPGIQALTALERREGPLTASDLSFGMIPRLNAPGRLGEPGESLAILMEADPYQAVEIAERLQGRNDQRRRLESEIASVGLADAEAAYSVGKKLVVVAGEGYHEGVRGIIAARIARRFGVPAIVFTLVDGEARGSGRSVGEVNLFAALEAASDLTLRYGGHGAAVGVTVSPGQLSEFERRLEAGLAMLPAASFHPPLLVDAQLPLGDLDWDGVQELERLEPYGQANAKPMFVSRPLSVRNPRTVGNLANHLSFKADDRTAEVSGIWFNCPDIDGMLAADKPLQLAFEPKADIWRGQRSLQVQVREAFQPDIDGILAAAFPEAASGLYPSQREALELLGMGRSPLCLMPTGRGKSLVFQMHATRLALRHRSLSVFVYPLRALLNDQQQRLSNRLGQIGLSSRVLCGQSTLEERDQAYDDIKAGLVTAILTTPEFLLLHARRIAEATDIAFIAIDEAHHIASETQAHRPAYQGLHEIRRHFPMAQLMAATATADAQDAAAIEAALGLDCRVIDASRRPNLKVIDQRGSQDRLGLTIDIVRSQDPCVVYTTSRDSARFLVRDLRRALPGQAMAINYYHAGLDREMRRQLEAGFAAGTMGCLVSTSAFGEGVDIPNIRHIVAFHPPFSRAALNQLAGRAGRDGHVSHIHLMFDAADLETNRSLLASGLPSRAGLAALYRYIRALSREAPNILLPDESLAVGAGRIDPESLLTGSQVNIGLRVFEELGLLAIDSQGHRRRLTVNPDAPRVDLASSSVYLEVLDEVVEFDRFSAWLTDADVAEIESLVQGPILPGAGMGERQLAP
jgi:single-stranded-DNA-specific exonuclease